MFAIFILKFRHSLWYCRIIRNYLS